jgi:hypothetical protein
MQGNHGWSGEIFYPFALCVAFCPEVKKPSTTDAVDGFGELLGLA